MLLPSLAFLLAALMPAPAQAETDPAIAARCEVARSVIAEQLDRPMKPRAIVSDPGFSREVSVNDFRRNWIGDLTPSAGFAAAFLKSPAVDVLEACPDIAATFANEGLIFGQAEIDKMMEEVTSDGRRSPVFDWSILALSLPVISADRQSALMHLSSTCGPLCGSGFVVYLKRDDRGVWKRQNSRASWIS